MSRRAVAWLTVCLLVVAAVPAAAAGGAALRVLTYNIHSGVGLDGRLDLARTARVITDSRADVVGLQEVDVHWGARSGYADQAAELARRTGMRVFFAPIYDKDPEPGRAERRRYGVAVLSRFPIRRAVNHAITRLSTVDTAPAGPMPGFAEAELDVRGRALRFYVTHLDHRPDPGVRTTQVADMLRLLGPGVLAGDLNAGPSAAELQPLFARLPPTSVDGLTFPADHPDRRLDYVLSTLTPVTTRIPADPVASDHRPVHTTLHLPTP
ncbi:endonuclease/exonuclease/phosphatase family protein [Amycolatopsis magusensis]|uniref:Endonuclease/exonuclease/phosphatase family metal-dependent hydrolase n=1 Tax=Amycolatopsis magusensis TaxID=882444 RepID=A0ABS4PT36_9PSEU|nr:endonuclease/exonuclease/phosphatase family protein [Amycolatopsis magusensis]MBP2182473.1 endonuclease/exonuclease/phosphatase family metal-dependent hydrolase [Amycolatopsis magusensis]